MLRSGTGACRDLALLPLLRPRLTYICLLLYVWPYGRVYQQANCHQDKRIYDGLVLRRVAFLSPKISQGFNNLHETLTKALGNNVFFVAFVLLLTVRQLGQIVLQAKLSITIDA